MIPIGIDDKYEIIRILQESAATAVLLVKYKPIGAFRILKAIHKASPDADSILSEAHLLQGIQSSHIPTIYDVDNTKEMIYFTEEYVEGISLREYLYKTKLQKEELLKIAIDICKVVECIHTQGNDPVIYRDMKPEHIILQNEGLKLIDFGIAIRLSEAKKAKSAGTPGWAAQEQIAGSLVDQRCDIYSVGKVIEFMQKNSYVSEDIRLKKIVEKAIEVDLSKRTQTIKEVKEQLEALVINKKNNKGRCLANKIAVIGADHGVGTTHIAIGLTRFFNRHNTDSYYRDMQKDTVHRLWENLKGTRIKESVLYHKDFRGLLNYGEAVEHYTPPNGLYILDCGTNIDIPADVDLIIYVIGSAPWNKRHYPEWIKDEEVLIINNFSDKVTSLLEAKALGKKVYRYPLVDKRLGLTKEEERFFTAILKNEKVFKV